MGAGVRRLSMHADGPASLLPGPDGAPAVGMRRAGVSLEALRAAGAAPALRAELLWGLLELPVRARPASGRARAAAPGPPQRWRPDGARRADAGSTAGALGHAPRALARAAGRGAGVRPAVGGGGRRAPSAARDEQRTRRGSRGSLVNRSRGSPNRSRGSPFNRSRGSPNRSRGSPGLLNRSRGSPPVNRSRGSPGAALRGRLGPRHARGRGRGGGGGGAHAVRGAACARRSARRGWALPPCAPPPPSCTDWTRLVPPPVLTGHVSSLLPYAACWTCPPAPRQTAARSPARPRSSSSPPPPSY